MWNINIASTNQLHEKHQESHYYPHHPCKIQILFPITKYMKNTKEVIIIHSIHEKSKYCFRQPNTWKGSHYYPHHPCKIQILFPTTKYMKNMKSLLFTTSMINLNIVSNNQIHRKHQGSHNIHVKSKYCFQ